MLMNAYIMYFKLICVCVVFVFVMQIYLKLFSIYTRRKIHFNESQRRYDKRLRLQEENKSKKNSYTAYTIQLVNLCLGREFFGGEGESSCVRYNK